MDASCLNCYGGRNKFSIAVCLLAHSYGLILRVRDNIIFLLFNVQDVVNRSLRMGSRVHDEFFVLLEPV